MAAIAAAAPSKKRVASDAPASVCPLSKKVATAKDMTWPNSGAVGGVLGWQYPPLPMGMMPPMPYCMAGNPFFPFMGMFPPLWLPAAAIAATMPALAAASAASASAAGGVLSVPATAAAMWPMMGCATGVQGLPTATMPAQDPSRTASGVSAGASLPSTSCSNSVPTAAAGTAPLSPPPQAASPVSVCNGGLQQAPEDDEFANFIDSFLSGDGDLLLRDGDGDYIEPTEAQLNRLQAGDYSSGGSNCSDLTTGGDPCLNRSDSHSLLSLLDPDIGLAGL